MGRGDKRTAKGKRFKKSFGNSRPARVKKKAAAKAAGKKEKAVKADKPTAKKAPAKKAAAKKKEE
ncbi:MAG TPA: 30S ribosomal protein THX [Chitinophagales bacterium]|nr:30S ribosomal protein THX [Chitinophagales bacterium]HLP52068.1 30S ribosomal protein THX [Chitinophagales bacterium]